MSLVRTLKRESSDKLVFVQGPMMTAFETGPWNWNFYIPGDHPGRRTMGLSLFLSGTEFTPYSIGVLGGRVQGINTNRRLRITDYFS